MRCKACNKPFNPDYNVTKTGKIIFDELCSECHAASVDSIIESFEDDLILKYGNKKLEE